MIVERYRAISRLTRVEPVIEGVVNEEQQARNLCPVWRSEADLPDAAKALYEKAAELAAIPLRTLIRGATQVETRLEAWCTHKAGKVKRDGGVRRSEPYSYVLS